MYRSTFAVLCLALVVELCLGSEPWSGIIGGEVLNERVPFVVKIQYNNSGTLEFMGGGVAISPDYILTAGHLVNDLDESDLPNVLVAYGANNIDEQLSAKITGFIQYFNTSTRLNDYAIIRVEGLDWNRAGNDSYEIVIGDVHPKQSVALAGWGALNVQDQEETLNQLQGTVLRVLDYPECRLKMLTPEYILRHPKIELNPESSFCLINPKTSPCYGDSGSPAFTLTGRIFTLFGVTSWGSTECALNSPTAFTRLHHFRDTIEKMTGFKRFV